MIPRKPTLPNNGSNLNRSFKRSSQAFANPARNEGRELATIRSHVRRGKRQNGEGFGGGRIVGK
jgi:hypothetical protein